MNAVTRPNRFALWVSVGSRGDTRVRRSRLNPGIDPDVFHTVELSRAVNPLSRHLRRLLPCAGSAADGLAPQADDS